MQRALSSLRREREAILSELARIDKKLAEESSLPEAKTNPFIALLNRGRDECLEEIQDLDTAIELLKSA